MPNELAAQAIDAAPAPSAPPAQASEVAAAPIPAAAPAPAEPSPASDPTHIKAPAPIAKEAHSLADIDALLDGNASTINVPASYVETTPAVEPAKATEAAPAPSATPAAEATPATDITTVPASDEIPGRIPTAKLEPQAKRALDLQHTLNNGKTPDQPGFVKLSECLAEIERRDAAVSPTAPPVEAPPSPVVTLSARQSELQTTLDTLLAERDQWGEEERLVTKDFTDLLKRIEATKDQLTDTKLELRDATAAEKALTAIEAEKAQKKADEQHITQRNAAIAKFPTADVPGSPLHTRVQEVVKRLQGTNDPKLYAENAATIVCSLAASELAAEQVAKGVPFEEAYKAFTAPAAASQPQAAAPHDPLAAPRKVMPAPGNMTGPAPAAAVSGDALAAKVTTAAEAEALLDSNLPAFTGFRL